MSYPPLEEQISVTGRIKKAVDTLQNGRVIYITISGSHLYGFTSKDSDVDYRGCYITGSENLLGLWSPKDVISQDTRDIPDDFPEDCVMFELAKEINLAVTGNCNVLEHLNAKPIYRTAEGTRLREMINNTYGKNGLYNSYRGMAMFNYRKFILQGKKSYKKYLYVFRGLMGGIYTLQTGRIQPNIIELNKYFKIPEVKVLIQHKIEGTEEEEVENLIFSGELDLLIPPLIERLDNAYLKSKIPDEPDEDGIAEINRWLIQQRIKIIGG